MLRARRSRGEVPVGVRIPDPIVSRADGIDPERRCCWPTRARRRVQATTTVPDTDLPRQREVAEAFLAASRDGDFEALVAVLDPDVVLGVEGPLPTDFEEIRGARNVAERALTYSRFAQHTQPALINGVPGLVTAAAGQPISVIAFTSRGGLIVEIDILADPSRLRELGLDGGSAGGSNRRG